MSADFIARLIGMVVFAILGAYFGFYLAGITEGQIDLYTVSVALLGALAGLILTPYITTRPIRSLRRLLARLSPQTLVSGLIGLIAGLIVAALLAFPISLLPSPFGDILPFFGVLFFGYLGIAVFVTRQNDIFSVMRFNLPGRSADKSANEKSGSRTILIDTSVIIDGRISDIARTGFLVGTLLIPRFVLNELQYIADSADNLRRQRGRRGMEVIGVHAEEPDRS